MSAESLKLLFEIYSRKKQIKSIKVAKTELTTKNSIALANLLGKNNCYDLIDLSFNKIGSEILKVLKKGLKTKTIYIQSLKLTSN